MLIKKSYLSSGAQTICTIMLIILTNITLGAPSRNIDSLKIDARIIAAKPSSANTAKEGFNFEKNMPWAAAILIGFLTVFTNLYINRKSRNSSLAIVEKQIRNAQSIALGQIEQSRINSERDFNKTVVSGARQIWINNLRDFISSILALNSKFLMYQTISDEDANELRLQIAKAELLLIASDHDSLLAVIKELERCCDEVQRGNETYDCIEEKLLRLKSQASIALREEWQKMKSGS